MNKTDKDKEVLMLKLFKQLDNDHKISTLDFIMFLRHRQKSTLKTDTSERDHSLIWMIDFLIDLPDDNFNTLLWMCKGMKSGLQSDQKTY